MSAIRVSIVALVLVYIVGGSHLPESSRDQYQAREDGSSPQLFTEATDQNRNVHKPHHRFEPPIKKVKKSPVPELQVGCGDGNVRTVLNKIRNRRDTEKIRERRGYYPWTNSVIQVPPLKSFRVWQPPVYQLSRPYFVPIWGVPGRIPLYFPPQPLYVNQGYPQDNPPLPPKGYLPPVTHRPTEEPEGTTMSLVNKFGEDGPVWDLVEDVTQRPQRPTTSIIPTRRPRPPGPVTHPPLVHRPGEEDDSTPAAPSLNELPPLPGNLLSRPTTTPSPPARQLSRCVLAVISCCSASSKDVDSSCFEQLGCAGPFWDNSPCESEFGRAAISAAMAYYNSQ